MMHFNIADNRTARIWKSGLPSRRSYRESDIRLGASKWFVLERKEGRFISLRENRY